MDDDREYPCPACQGTGELQPPAEAAQTPGDWQVRQVVGLAERLRRAGGDGDCLQAAAQMVSAAVVGQALMDVRDMIAAVL